MKYLAIIGAKLASVILKFRGGGSSYPGLLARKLDKNILSKLTLPENTIFVTATNGKTTTANLISHILEENGVNVINNSKGANLEAGIATLLLNNSSLGGKVKADYLVIEIDEQTIPSVFKQVNPKVLVINNFFRDQLDRYSEIDTLLQKIESSLSPDIQIIANGNDPLVVNLLKNHENKLFYTASENKYTTKESTQTREGKFCPICSKKLHYNFYHYAQLGDFVCECGFRTPQSSYVATDIDLKLKHIIINDRKFMSKYDSYYHYFNILPAFATISQFQLQDTLATKESIFDFIIDDGRMETFEINNKNVTLNLVKNPAGMNENVNYLAQHNAEDKTIMFVLNNFAADSKDTAWIYDVDFEKFARLKLSTIICSGTRAYDMASRLEYAGVERSKIFVYQDLNQAFKNFQSNLSETNFIFSTYTALQKTRTILKDNKR
jgi:UDP-N-acetylmuramyl tripeptide synthase